MKQTAMAKVLEETTFTCVVCGQGYPLMMENIIKDSLLCPNCRDHADKAIKMMKDNIAKIYEAQRQDKPLALKKVAEYVDHVKTTPRVNLINLKTKEV